MNQMTAIAASPENEDRARFTTAEFLPIATAADELGIKLELIEGEMYRMTPPMRGHFVRQSQVFGSLLQAVAGTQCVAVVEAGIELGDGSLVACDAAVLHEDPARGKFLAPDEIALAVEIAETTLGKDLGVKRRAYGAAGVGNYWVVDANARVTHVFADPRDGAYASESEVRFGEPLAVPGTDATIVID